jgi:beta-galactosidase/beta-glucuronidase
VFEGVDYFAEVSVNDRVAGRHEGYFQRSELDITRLLRAGVNRLAVAVTSPREEPGPVWPDLKRMIKGAQSLGLPARQLGPHEPRRDHRWPDWPPASN